jgi:hypothetical protein
MHNSGDSRRGIADARTLSNALTPPHGDID